MADRAAAQRRRIGFRAVGTVLLLVLAGWGASGFYTLAPNERGIITRFGGAHAKVAPGLGYRLPWPIDRLHRVATTDVQRIEVGFATLGRKWSEPRRSDALSGDENILKVMMVVQYRVRDPQTYLFATAEPRWLVERAVETSLNHLIAALTVDQVLTTAKDEIQVRTIERAQALLDSYHSGLVLLGGNLNVVDPPQPVAEAFIEVASAKKDAERVMDEAREFEGKILPQAAGMAQQVLSEAHAAAVTRTQEARGQAARFTALLAEYQRAPGLMRARMFLETIEQVFAQVRIVIVDELGGRITLVEPNAAPAEE